MNAVELRGLFFALISGLSGAVFAQGYKLRTRLGYRPRPLVLAFAVWYCLLSAALASVLGAWRYSLPLLALGAVLGVLFPAAIYLYMRVSEKARLNISWTIVQISVVLPFGLSIIFFGERPNPLSWAGIGAIGAAIFIFALAKWKEGGQGEPADGKMLLMLVASSMLPYTGGSMLAFALVLAGAIVYPVRNVACVLIVTLLSALLFGERASKLELLGVGVSLCGIALVSAAL